MPDKIDLSAPEVQSAIQAAVDAAVAPLANKNKELLAELKTARKSAEITPEQLAAVEDERDQLKADLSAAQKQVKEAMKSAETATKALEAESGFTTKLLADNGLSDALVKAGVNNPAHLKMVKAGLIGQVQVVTEGDQRIAKVGDKTLADFVTEWAKSDEGKHFVSAQQNSGGGAGGGNGGGNGGKTMTRTAFDAASHAERAAFAKSGGTVVDD